MSKILLVEPRPITRQAISVALFPEHDLQFATLVSDVDRSAAQEFDLIILDSAAFRQTGKTSGGLLQQLQDWKIPTLLIEDASVRQAHPRGKIKVLKSPIQKDALKSAIASCLDGASANHNHGLTRPTKGRTTPQQTTTPGDARAGGAQIIELVDVVAEPPERDKDKAAEITTK